MNSPLQGGTRRRPRRYPRRVMALLALVAASARGAAVLYLTVLKDDGPTAAAPRPNRGPDADVKTPTRPATQVPPGVSLVGPNAFNVRLKSGKPRAALVFDMKTGRVLYKRNPLQRL